MRVEDSARSLRRGAMCVTDACRKQMGEWTGTRADARTIMDDIDEARIIIAHDFNMTYA